MKFKVTFPTGYQIKDTYSDNIDIHVITENGDVYFGTLFTIMNIQEIMLKEMDCSYFWATDMVILKNLKLDTISSAIYEIISKGYQDFVLSKIGEIGKLYPNLSYDQIESFCPDNRSL